MFQRAVDATLQDLDFVFVNLDDVLIASQNKEDHKRHLTTLFERLSKHGFAINPAKCVFAKSSITFLGHQVSAEGIHPLEEWVPAVENFPQPTHLKQLQEFLGIINFYYRFLPGAAHTLAPLHSLVADHTRANIKLRTWDKKSQEAFSSARTILSQAVLLNHPVQGAQLALTTDVSVTVVGAVVEQFIGEGWQTVGVLQQALTTPPRSNTQPLTANSLLSTSRSSIFTSFWKVVTFEFIQTINLWLLCSVARPIHGQPARLGTSQRSPSFLPP